MCPVGSTRLHVAHPHVQMRARHSRAQGLVQGAHLNPAQAQTNLRETSTAATAAAQVGGGGTSRARICMQHADVQYLLTSTAHVTSTRESLMRTGRGHGKEALHPQPSLPPNPAAQTNSILHVPPCMHGCCLHTSTARSSDLVHVHTQTCHTARKPVR